MPIKRQVFAFILSCIICLIIASCTAGKGTNDTTQLTGTIDIIETNSFKDAHEYWYFYGLVRNATNHNIADPQVKIKLLDANGIEIYSYTVHAMLPNLAPGESSPFSDFTANPYPNGRTMQAIVIENQTSESFSRGKVEFKGVTLWASESNVVYLAGEVTNKNSKPVRINAIAGSLVDEEGKLITASAAFPFLSYVDANESSPFIMAFDTPLGKATSLQKFKLYSDAYITNPITKNDIVTGEKSFKYQDAKGNMHLVGVVTNNANKPLNIYMVAGLYDKRGNCVDANAVYVPVPLNPGESFPYDFSSWAAADKVPEAYDVVTEVRLFVDQFGTRASSSPSYKLSTKDDINAFDGIEGRFNGTVVNSSGKDLSAVFVNVSLYDKVSGVLIATNLTDVPSATKKDASGTYELYLSPPNDIDPAKVSIVITAIGE